MAEECAYYYYENGYCCELKRRKEGTASIDSDTVHRYCWGYQYENCPRYKRRSFSSGPCFLTSACVESKGLPDDCYELTILRAFRDGYMRSLPSGNDDIVEYYNCAPAIVAAIKNSPDSKELFDRIYKELVVPCVELIEAGKNHEAYCKYKSYTRELRRTYTTAIECG